MDEYVARICWNTRGWTMPTGEAAELEERTYAARMKFGHEEWLFDEGALVDGWQYGFLQPVNKSRSHLAGQTLSIGLFTVGPRKSWFHAGWIQNCEILTPELAEPVRRHFKEVGRLEEMEAQVRSIGGDTSGLRYEDPCLLLNVRFRPEQAERHDPLVPIGAGSPIRSVLRYVLARKTGEGVAIASNWPTENRVRPIAETPDDRKEWSEAEFEAAVVAYLAMLKLEIQGVPYSKKGFNRELQQGALSARTAASIEYRMQNISSVMEELCLPRIRGYLPAKNVGTSAKDRIRRILAAKGAFDPTEYAPSADETALAERVNRLRSRPLVGCPRGIEKPERVERSASSFVRDPLVRAWVLQCACGTCEGCGTAAPFALDDGSPFLEVHHVRTMADGGSDRTSNAIALCPNCHRRCHLSYDRVTFIGGLYQRVARLVRE